MTAAEVRVPHARLIVVLAALAFSAAILWLTRGYTFYFDEWTFILTAPDWTLATLLQPHNEHPVMLTRAIYAALLATVGLRSYLPYMAVLLALHAASAVLLFEVVRRRAGDLVGIACAALLLVLGAGWEDLLWAFQMQFVGSVACGLGMLLAAREPRGGAMPIVAAAADGLVDVLGRRPLLRDRRGRAPDRDTRAAPGACMARSGRHRVGRLVPCVRATRRVGLACPDSQHRWAASLHDLGPGRQRRGAHRSGRLGLASLLALAAGAVGSRGGAGGFDTFALRGRARPGQPFTPSPAWLAGSSATSSRAPAATSTSAPSSG